MRRLPRRTLHMHQDSAFDGVQTFRQAVARDVEQCIATAHLRSGAASSEEDGEPAVGSGGEMYERKALFATNCCGAQQCSVQRAACTGRSGAEA